jgi:hypothetical protein
VTGQGLDGLNGHTRLLRAGEVGMARFVAGPMDQSGPGPCGTEDFIPPFGGQGLSTSRSFESNKQMIGCCIGWSFLV